MRDDVGAAGLAGPDLSDVTPPVEQADVLTELDAAASATLRRRRRRKRETADVSDVAPTTIAAVFSNLIILEEALRAQYMEVRSYRRQHAIFFWSTLAAAIYLSYLNLLHPSQYQGFRVAERVLAIAAYLTLVLFFMTGMYTRLFVVSPRFVLDANRGLRAFNVRLVRLRSSWNERLLRTLWTPNYMESHGRLVKIVPSPRVFSPHFIEAWEIYRHEFWEQHQLKLSKQKQKKAVAKS